MYCVQAVCYTLKVIWQNFAKTYQKVIKFCIILRTFCYSWVTFIEISIKSGQPAVV